MARAAIGWGVGTRKRAGLTANTVTRIENGADAKQSTMDRLQQALEAAGVEFIERMALPGGVAEAANEKGITGLAQERSAVHIPNPPEL